MHESAPDFVPRPAQGLAHRNVMAMFAARVRKSAHQPALRHKHDGSWRTISWARWQQASRELAAGLISIGITPGQRVAILARTRQEWVVADLGIAMAGGVSVPIYPSLAADQVQAILDDSGAVAVIVEDGQGRSLVSSTASAVRHIIVIADPEPEPDGPVTVHGWDAVCEAGREALVAEGPIAEALDALEQRIGPDDPMTFVYTSGATGEPKGAVLAHRNLIYESWAIKNVVPVAHTDEQLLVLPLAHIFARHLVWATVEQGAVSAFAESESRIYANFQEIAPTFVAAVPRMYERAYASILEQAGAPGSVTRAVFDRALEVGRRVSRLRQRGSAVPTALSLQHALAERAVLSRVRARFGGRIRFFVSGGAPLSRHVAEMFHATGLLVLEGYGLSETSGATHVNRPDRYRFGTVGPALPGCETEIADDGEVLIRAPSVMARYHGHPQLSAEAIDAEGWLHTGDIGELRDGFLRITDRKKDLIKTSTGKYVAPLMIEKRLRIQEGIAHATVCGDARPHVVALISLDAELMLSRSDREGLGCDGYADLAVHPRIRQLIQTHVDEVNAGLSRHERVRAFYVVPSPYGERTGELTPTRKVKRPVVLDRYADAIEELFATAARDRPTEGRSGPTAGFSS
ncbi:MAG: long-chain fatty acid--CoA ligase [Deltaproteobacteria bacterium]|nr:long-chain fatty acid--CoA ligase [Deltaproteobacteria bacterium]